MTSRASAFVLSVPFVAGLNALVLVLVVLSMLGLLPSSANQSLAARIIPAFAPGLTIAFLLSSGGSKALAALSLVANFLILAVGVIFLLLVAVRSTAAPDGFALVLLLLFAAFCVFVPLLSGLAVA